MQITRIEDHPIYRNYFFSHEEYRALQERCADKEKVNKELLAELAQAKTVLDIATEAYKQVFTANGRA